MPNSWPKELYRVYTLLNIKRNTQIAISNYIPKVHVIFFLLYSCQFFKKNFWLSSGKNEIEICFSFMAITSQFSLLFQTTFYVLQKNYKAVFTLIVYSFLFKVYCGLLISFSILCVVSVGEPINHEAWEWLHNVVGDSRCTLVDTWWQTGESISQEEESGHTWESSTSGSLLQQLWSQHYCTENT